MKFILIKLTIDWMFYSLWSFLQQKSFEYQMLDCSTNPALSSRRPLHLQLLTWSRCQLFVCLRMHHHSGLILVSIAAVSIGLFRLTEIGLCSWASMQWTEDFLSSDCNAEKLITNKFGIKYLLEKCYLENQKYIGKASIKCILLLVLKNPLFK